MLYGEPLNRLEVTSGGAVFAHAVPEGAQLPDVHARPGGISLSGALAGGGRYAMALSEGGERLLLSESGREASWQGGALRVVQDLHDTVGHARLRLWAPTEGDYAVTEEELLWSEGAPNWPSSPVETTLAAIEAMQLGLIDEAAGYLSPEADVRTRQTLRDLAEWDGCVPLKRALADGRSAVGATRAVSQNLTAVTPVYFSCSPGGGAQGYWRVDWLKIADRT
jgi:hypothetical protein